MESLRFLGRALVGAAFAAVLVAATASAQVRPPERVVRTYVPPDQLVAFGPGVPFDRFLAALEPIFQRVTGKTPVDPEGRTSPIGVNVQGMHFFDAFVYVLARQKLTYRENDRYFVVADQAAEAVAAEEVTTERPSAQTPQQSVFLEDERAGDGASTGVNLGTREVKINAVIFDLNVSKARDLGVDWRTFFKASGGVPNGGLGDPQAPLNQGTQLGVGDFFDLFGDRVTGPSSVSFAQLGELFRFFEDRGLGRTVANPNIVVQSGKEGRIQVGADIPIQTRDFAGNTQTQLIPTGVIIKVTPTLISEAADTSAGAPVIDFAHLDVLIERSAPGLFNGAVSISRNQATTNVLLVDGEQTVIGGLFSTERTTNKSGIAGLKDIPLLGRLFSHEEVVETQRELLVVLQAEVVRSVTDRAQNPAGEQDLLEQRRNEIRERLRTTTPALNPAFSNPNR